MLLAEGSDLREVSVVGNEDSARRKRNEGIDWSVSLFSRPSSFACSVQRREIQRKEGKEASNSPSLSLDGLDKECANLLSVRLESLLDSGDVVVLDLLGRSRKDGSDSLEEGSEADSRLGVRRHRHDTEGASVEITVKKERKGGQLGCDGY